MNLVKYFGAAYLINLPERTDRLESANRQLARVGWQIGPADVQLFPAKNFTERAGFPSAAACGCFHSHLECLRQAHRDNKASVLILEDDIALSSSLARLTPSIISRLESVRWDFLYLGHEATGSIPPTHRKMKEDELRFEAWTQEIRTTHFYAVRGRILPALIAHLDLVAAGREGDQELGPMPIDGAYNIFRRRNNDVRCFIAHPKLGWQRSSRSDITPRKFDSWSFLRPITAVARNLKHMFKVWQS
jgi:hypothetical protein